MNGIEGIMLGLFPLNYHIYVHDPNFFLLSYIPQTFPGLRIQKDFTNYGTKFWISVTMHYDQAIAMMIQCMIFNFV